MEVGDLVEIRYDLIEISDKLRDRGVNIGVVPYMGALEGCLGNITHKKSEEMFKLDIDGSRFIFHRDMLKPATDENENLVFDFFS